ncbi:YlxR family protein [Dermabacter sp. Marseille-Q3180]|uniref:YlxR family protein n=1 Tax=Dermabacter sp. Marseille-Q3180 TaxID=2758090 RepID=UPI0024E0E7FB|nr:YlxR family protein [Dermabacter sp. Marseille-Q3180]
MGCRKSGDRHAMIRVVREGGGASLTLVVDPSGSAHGRGAWVHPDRACIAFALTRGGFQRSFRAPVDVAALAKEGTLERACEAMTHPNRGAEPHLEAG